MKVLVIYATNSGSTELVAKQIVENISSNRTQINLVKAKDVTDSLVRSYKKIIIGTPSWFEDNQEGMPHRDIIDMMSRFKNVKLATKEIALFGLGDNSYAEFCQGIDHVSDFFIDKKKASKINNTLKIDGYYFNKEKHNKLIKNWCSYLNKKWK